MSQEALVESIEFDLASPNGCSEAFSKLNTLKEKYGETKDYYYYRGYCLQESNPGKACASFASFLQLKPSASDGHTALAEQYIKSQNSKLYPACAVEIQPVLSASVQEALDRIRSTIAAPEGCTEAFLLLEDFKKKYKANADYYYYKAYCYGDSNPEKACAEYTNFLKIAKTDTRASQAKQYIVSQDSVRYRSCVLPN
jgi:hypothetical protein